MNNARRKKLSTVSGLLDRAIGIITTAAEEEQDALDNLPESFQDTDRYEKMENAVELMESAVEQMECIKELLDDAKK